MRRFVPRTATIAGAIAVAACVENAPVSPTSNTITASANSNSALQLSNARSYIIDFTGNDLPADLSAQVAKAGGTLTSSIGQVGVAVASSDDPSFADRAGKIKGVFSVELDPMVQWVQPERVVEAGEAGPDVSVEPTASFGAAETFRRAQWVPDQISAPAAWDAGALGAGVRVAILDGGIRSTHIDIAPELDVARSAHLFPIPRTPARSGRSTPTPLSADPSSPRSCVTAQIRSGTARTSPASSPRPATTSARSGSHQPPQSSA